MAFDYRKLTGKIVEVCGTKTVFAEKLGITRVSLTNKLKGRNYFTQEEIIKACDILGLEDREAFDYFFNRRVNEN